MGERIEDRGSRIEDCLPPDVRLYRMRYEATQAGAWRALLPEEERARLDGYGVEKRRREFLLGRVVARHLLAEVLGCTPQAVPLSVADDGAVEVHSEKKDRLRLSISHAEDEAAAAVARRPVGVDLERPQPRPERLHRFLLSKEERPLLGRLSLPEDDAFALCWALKEAVLKALRCGLRRSPKIVRLADVALNAAADAGHARISLREETRSFEAQFVREGALWLALAYEEKMGPPE